MSKQFWINLPVKSIAKSKEFFTKLGFSFNLQHGNSEDSASLVLGDKSFVVMLFSEATFKKFTRNDLVDTKQGNEVLLSIDADTRQEVDDLAKKAVEAGGQLFGGPEDHQGWMYGCGFSDLDGHRWNVLFRDMTKIPKS